MKRVASFQSLADLGHLRNMLEQAGIRCIIKNEQLSGGLGEIPFLECMPELWVVNDAKLDEARKLLEEFRAEPAKSASWRCSTCGELNEGQFAACWQCGEPDSPK